MSTYAVDLQLLDNLLEALDGPWVVPYYGVHPWYSHLFTVLQRQESEPDTDFKTRHYTEILSPPPTPELLKVLPDPIDFEAHLVRIEALIAKHSRFQYGIGEIGLDKLFRVPASGYFGRQIESDSEADSGGLLSPSRVGMKHQLAVFERQLAFAQKLGKPVSVHGVKAHGILYDTVLKYPRLPTIILHSYSGSVDQARLWIRHYAGKGQLYFSFSYWLNGVDKKTSDLEQIVEALDPKQILLETDMSVDSWFLKRNEEYYGHLSKIFTKISLSKGLQSSNEQKEFFLENMRRSIGIDRHNEI